MAIAPGERTEHIIGGRPVESHGQDRFEVVNPATEEVIGSVPAGDAADVDAAVETARRAFHESGWPSTPVKERAAILRAIADGFERHADEMKNTIIEENGSVVPIAEWGNVKVPAALYRYYADLLENTELEEQRVWNGARTVVRQEPVGVCGLVTAWNVPQGIYVEKVGPAIATGCTAVLKPAPETPYDAYLFMDILKEAGVPDGVVNVVFGGADTGAALVGHRDIDKVSFTGSPGAGRAIARACAENLTPNTLELGGKSAAILLDDFDLETFLPWIGGYCIAHSGQICSLMTRLVVPRSRYRETLDAVADTMRAMKVGDPADPATEIGPVVAGRQRDRVEGYIRSGVDEGARLVTGGGRPKGMDRGFFVEPTLFADVSGDMTIARDEIFGPVLVAIPYDDEEDAVRIANDSRYGLGGAVFGADVEHATAVAGRVETGTIGVNYYQQHFNAPFGGVKDSGYGRELGPEGYAAYLKSRSIYLAS
ncbi:aldehyde dehydrogenase [Amycolatopsis acidicola]|uniref:Aldehyde dehydrogenase n=1 Tax=Amycolatopsis acidicola TaxID=2596893 RepID=A0A5N0UQD2_9PSEU|nr:aldehyde dehydrogenase [Amycolatopsis acidicola]KAA9153441.1 aldehyde dehydrogenase [Amycolatopsis acidicola]